MNKIVVLVSLMALVFQAQGKVNPTYDSVGGDIVCYDVPISAVEKQIGNPTSAQEKEVLEKALELLKKGKQIAQLNHKFSWAVYKKDFEMMKVFLKDGACVDALGANGRPALLESCSGEASFEIAKYLVENHANVNAQCFQGFTALMCASCSGNVDIVKLLLKNGADTELKDKKGKTAIWWAENQNRADILKLLKENVNIASKGKADVAKKEQSSTLEVDNNVILDTFTMSKSEMAGCQFTGGKVFTPILGRVYKYENGLKVVQLTPAGYLVIGVGESFIIVKAPKKYLDDSLSFATGQTYLKAGLFKYIGEKEYTTKLGETKNVYCFEVCVDEHQSITQNTSTFTEKALADNNNVVTSRVGYVEARLIHPLAPRYPMAERRKKIEGRVAIECVVDKNGSAREFRVKTSSGFKELDEAAIKALRTAELEPALQDGIPVESKFNATINFQLNQLTKE
jgi:TonB family protein